MTGLLYFLSPSPIKIFFGRELTSAAVFGGLLIIAAFSLLSWATWKEMVEESEKETVDSISEDADEHDD